MAAIPLFNVLLIDAQKDFSDGQNPLGGGPGNMGRLPVINAHNDLQRIAKFLSIYGGKINTVFASMDTHTTGHIGHGFWRRKGDGQIAPAGTFFTVDDDKIWSFILVPKKNSNVLEIKLIDEYEVNVSNPLHQVVMDKYAKAYITQVKSRGKEGRNAVNTWNLHCLENSSGWNIDSTVKAALDSLEGKVQYYIKGQNQLAEMYSIFAAEVPYEELITIFPPEEQAIIEQYKYNDSYPNGDLKFNSVGTQGGLIAAAPVVFNYTAKDKSTYPGENINQEVNLQTSFNEELFEKITAGGHPIIVCGEALSHCVQFSARDLVKEILERGKENKVYILKNGSSPVVLGIPEVDANFAKSADDFITFMETGNKGQTGVLTLKDDGSFDGVLAGGRRRRRRTTHRHRKAKKSKKTRKH